MVQELLNTEVIYQNNTYDTEHLQSLPLVITIAYYSMKGWINFPIYYGNEVEKNTGKISSKHNTTKMMVGFYITIKTGKNSTIG